jgi:hypothetical protein
MTEVVCEQDLRGPDMTRHHREGRGRIAKYREEIAKPPWRCLRKAKGAGGATNHLLATEAKMADRIHADVGSMLILRAFSVGQSVEVAEKSGEVADRPARGGWEAVP